MDLIRNVLDLAISPSCTNSILALNFNDHYCVKLTISKILSYGIVLGAMLVKAPQITNILLSSSVSGISFLSLILETTAILISLGYNFREGNAFSTYGEGVFITLQNVVLLFLILKFTENLKSLPFVLLSLSTLLYYVVIVSSGSMLTKLQMGTVFIGIASKLPQIVSNYRNGPGQLSVITTFLQFAGTVARVGTTIQEVNDKVILISFIVTASLNAIVLAQIVLTKKAKKE